MTLGTFLSGKCCLYLSKASAKSLSKNATSQQLVKYAGASGDYYQIHYDDGFARNNGLPGIIIHGALKNAFLGQLVTDWMGPNGQLKKLSVSYRAMDIPNEDLVCSGTVTDKRVEDGVGRRASIDVSIDSWNDASKTAPILGLIFPTIPWGFAKEPGS